MTITTKCCQDFRPFKEIHKPAYMQTVCLLSSFGVLMMWQRQQALLMLKSVFFLISLTHCLAIGLAIIP